MREEYGTFFDGMTQSARELYQVCFADADSQPVHDLKSCCSIKTFLEVRPSQTGLTKSERTRPVDRTTKCHEKGLATFPCCRMFSPPVPLPHLAPRCLPSLLTAIST